MTSKIRLKSLCLFIALYYFDTIFVNCEDSFKVTSEEVAYLEKYGYLNGTTRLEKDLEIAYSRSTIEEALKTMQNFAGLHQTGVLDAPTKQLFRRKRCGVRDIFRHDNSRKRRYSIQAEGWTNRIITYRVTSGSRTLSKDRVEALMEKAFNAWAPHGGLHFLKKNEGRADIEISFFTGEHGDGSAFDGPGTVIGHAFPPPHGAMHFDDDELWIDKYSFNEEDADDGTDFFATALHEVGHALGLNHSNDTDSVMNAYYQGTDELQMDDILGMRKLYLNNYDNDDSTNLPAVPFTKSESIEYDMDNELPDICLTNYDTIQVIQGKIFVFEEEWVWVLPQKKVVEEGYPKNIHEVFEGLPNSITAIKSIYEKYSGDIVVFSGRNYWVFDPKFHLRRTGTLTDYRMPLYVKELSSVFLSNFNNKTYLFHYEHFWRYDESRSKMDKKYPKPMSAWRKLPYPVDAALVWEEDTYFFQGPRFWRFDNKLVEAHKNYPAPVAPIWFPCDENAEMIEYTRNQI